MIAHAFCFSSEVCTVYLVNLNIFAILVLKTIEGWLNHSWGTCPVIPVLRMSVRRCFDFRFSFKFSEGFAICKKCQLILGKIILINIYLGIHFCCILSWFNPSCYFLFQLSLFSIFCITDSEYVLHGELQVNNSASTSNFFCVVSVSSSRLVEMLVCKCLILQEVTYATPSNEDLAIFLILNLY